MTGKKTASGYNKTLLKTQHEMRFRWNGYWHYTLFPWLHGLPACFIYLGCLSITPWPKKPMNINALASWNTNYFITLQHLPVSPPVFLAFGYSTAMKHFMRICGGCTLSSSRSRCFGSSIFIVAAVFGISNTIATRILKNSLDFSMKYPPSCCLSLLLWPSYNRSNCHLDFS